MHVKTYFSGSYISHDFHPFIGLDDVYAAVGQDTHAAIAGEPGISSSPSRSRSSLLMKTTLPASLVSTHRRREDDHARSCHARSAYPTCNRTFDRVQDRDRHAKKYQPGMQFYHCVVLGVSRGGGELSKG